MKRLIYNIYIRFVKTFSGNRGQNYLSYDEYVETKEIQNPSIISTVILDKKEYDSFKINTIAISDVTARLKTTNIMVEFKKYILENHPDPDTLLVLDNDVFEQMCRLATDFAQDQNNVGLGSVSNRFEIEFDTHLMADIEIKDNVPIIKRAVDGWGGIVKTEDCLIKKV